MSKPSRLLDEDDVRYGCGKVYLPHELERKYRNAATE